MASLPLLRYRFTPYNANADDCREMMSRLPLSVAGFIQAAMVTNPPGKVMVPGLLMSTRALMPSKLIEPLPLPAGTTASIYIEKVNAASEFISLTGTTLLTGANWNPGVESEVQ